VEPMPFLKETAGSGLARDDLAGACESGPAPSTAHSDPTLPRGERWHPVRRNVGGKRVLLLWTRATSFGCAPPALFRAPSGRLSRGSTATARDSLVSGRALQLRRHDLTAPSRHGQL
jgi:hypothetical protein